MLRQHFLSAREHFHRSIRQSDETILYYIQSFHSLLSTFLQLRLRHSFGFVSDSFSASSATVPQLRLRQSSSFVCSNKYSLPTMAAAAIVFLARLMMEAWKGENDMPEATPPTRVSQLRVQQPPRVASYEIQHLGNSSPVWVPDEGLSISSKQPPPLLSSSDTADLPQESTQSCLSCSSPGYLFVFRSAQSCT